MKNKFKEFHRFKELFPHEGLKVSKKYKSDLQREAKEWFIEQFGAIFGSTSRVDTKNEITWHYSCGLLAFGFPGLGDYHYKYIIKMIHMEYWKLKPFIDGCEYGRHCSRSKMKPRNDNYRDGNPYQKSRNYFYYEAWDAGYIMGLSNYSFFNS